MHQSNILALFQMSHVSMRQNKEDSLQINIVNFAY
jgi:hypothetical protein